MAGLNRDFEAAEKWGAGQNLELSLHRWYTKREQVSPGRPDLIRAEAPRSASFEGAIVSRPDLDRADLVVPSTRNQGADRVDGRRVPLEGAFVPPISDVLPHRHAGILADLER